MATLNPLEQKARSSFIKGVLLASLIGLVIVGILGLMIYTMQGEQKAIQKSQVDVLVATQTINSGDEITEDMYTTAKVLVQKKIGKERNNILPEGVLTAENIEKVTTIVNSDGTVTKYKLIAKIDIPANTTITASMVNSEESIVTDDLRDLECNTVLLPSEIGTGKTIDIRLRIPGGADYIVVSKKKVTIPEVKASPNTMIIKVNEGEILTLNAAIVDAYKIPGSKLYATQYSEPGLQEKATETYIPSSDTINLINNDPNIVMEARNALITIYNNFMNYRTPISNELNKKTGEEQDELVTSGTESEIQQQQEQRQEYLDSLGQSVIEE